MRKRYYAPQLKVHGTVQQLTKDVIKRTGVGDYYAADCLAPLSPIC